MSQPRGQRANLFVSYSGRDTFREKPFVREFLYCLRRQKLSVWIYEKPDERIPEGFDIGDYCRGKIEAADYVIIFLTPTTFSSAWTRAEAAHAIEKNKPIFQIRDSLLPEDGWSSEYLALRDQMAFSCSFENLSEAERSVSHLLDRLGIPPLDRNWSDSSTNIALAAGLKREISSLTFPSEFENWIYYQLRIDSERCCRSYLNKNLEESKNYLDRVISTIEIETHPDERALLYYPYLLRCVLQIETSNSMTVVENTYHEIERRRLEESPYFDENILVLKAIIQRLRGFPEDAVRYLKMASEHITNKGILDPEILHHLFWGLAGEDHPLTPEVFKILSWKPEEQDRASDTIKRNQTLKATQAIVRGFHRNEWPTAPELETFPTEILLHTQDLNCNRHLNYRIQSELVKRSFDSESPERLEVLRAAGLSSLNLGEFSLAISFFETLVRESWGKTEHLDHAVHLASILDYSGKKEGCLRVANKYIALAPSSYGADICQPDYDYLIGRLHWLRGDRHLACLFFQRTGFEHHRFYEQKAVNKLENELENETSLRFIMKDKGHARFRDRIRRRFLGL